MEIKSTLPDTKEDSLVLVCVDCTKKLGEAGITTIGTITLKCERCKAIIEIALPSNKGKTLKHGNKVFTFKRDKYTVR
jgi:phage FluMu protein Com